MRKKLISILSLLLIMSACEEVYNPTLKVEDNYLVVEATLIADDHINYINLYRSNIFGEKDEYEKVSGAVIKLTNDSGDTFPFYESSSGEYQIDKLLSENRSYSIIVEIDGETYASEYQPVPDTPSIDSIYGAYDNKVYIVGAANSKEDIVKKYGIQFYSDMIYKGNLIHYRYSGRKVLQYIAYIDTLIYGMPSQISKYAWKSYHPTSSFNICGPAEFSTEKDIFNHKLEFFINNYTELLGENNFFRGWIYIIDQYGINEDTYNYYNDLNSQLEAEGKIFDPVYVQPVGNIVCTSNPGNIVLGNFEIASHKQYRYFLIYNKNINSITLKPIPHFYDVPENGTKNNEPDFWESFNKIYPD